MEKNIIPILKWIVIAKLFIILFLVIWFTKAPFIPSYQFTQKTLLVLV